MINPFALLFASSFGFVAGCCFGVGVDAAAIVLLLAVGAEIPHIYDMVPHHHLSCAWRMNNAANDKKILIPL